MSARKPEVGIVMGSDSDWPVLEHTVQTLEAFGLPYEVRVISAHRTPGQAVRYATTATRRGLRVLIAAAGGAAHLAGVLAAHVNVPVIGVPVPSATLGGLDSLLSTVQMPAGVPVATVALGRAGAVNAAILAAQILAVGRPALARKLARHRQSLARKVDRGNARVRELLQRRGGGTGS